MEFVAHNLNEFNINRDLLNQVKDLCDIANDEETKFYVSQTSNLISAYLENSKFSLAYAISKFVTLAFQNMVKKNPDYVSHPMPDVITDMGLPSYLVLVRNEIVHGTCPAIELLDLIFADIMNWTREAFWNKYV